MKVSVRLLASLVLALFLSFSSPKVCTLNRGAVEGGGGRDRNGAAKPVTEPTVVRVPPAAAIKIAAISDVPLEGGPAHLLAPQGRHLDRPALLTAPQDPPIPIDPQDPPLPRVHRGAIHVITYRIEEI